AGSGRRISTLIGHDSMVLDLAFSPNGSQLASCGRDSLVRLWDIRTGQRLLSLKANNWVSRLAFNSDGSRIAACESAFTGRSAHVRVWSTSTGQELLAFSQELGAVSLAFSPDGKFLATGGWDKTVRLWDARTGEPVLTLRGHDEGVEWVAFTPE